MNHFPIFLVQKAVLETSMGGDGKQGRAFLRSSTTSNADNGQLGPGEGPEPCSYEPRVSTIDAVLATEFPATRWATRPITLLKMDIESKEVQALRGATSLLRDPRRKPCVMILEHHAATPAERTAFCALLLEHA